MVMQALKSMAPWQAKMASKLILSALPVEYRTWQLLRLFRHGEMDDPEYAFEVFKLHFKACGSLGGRSGFVSLELGPGDSLFTCLLARAFGGARTWLVDAGNYAKQESGAYRSMSTFLNSKGVDPRVSDYTSLSSILEQSNARYLVNGLASVREIPDRSVDWIWSHAVLEHLPSHVFRDYMVELRRVLRDDGVCSHRIDLRDHLGGALNNLRFSEALWESKFMAGAGFYTNRIRFDDMCEAFEYAGFDVELGKVNRWSKLPTPRSRMARQFRSKSDEVLLVKEFDVVLRPRLTR